MQLLIDAACALSPALRVATPHARAAHPTMVLDAPTALYELQLSAERAVTSTMTSVSPASAAILYGAGLITSLSPCAPMTAQRVIITHP